MREPLPRLWWLPFGAVPEIDPADLHRALLGPSPPFLIDVRSPTEWRSSRIDGALNLPITDLAALRAFTPPTDAEVVAICLSAHRSVPAVRLLGARGIPIRHLAGGMRSWWALGLPTVGTSS